MPALSLLDFAAWMSTHQQEAAKMWPWKMPTFEEWAIYMRDSGQLSGRTMPPGTEVPATGTGTGGMGGWQGGTGGGGTGGTGGTGVNNTDPTKMPDIAPAQGYQWKWSAGAGQYGSYGWTQVPIEGTSGGVTGSTRTGQFNYDNSGQEYELVKYADGESRWEPTYQYNAQYDKSGAGTMTPYQGAQTDLERQKFEWDKQVYDRNLAEQKAQRLAEMEAQPITWLQFGKESGLGSYVQPWMKPLMPEQYGLDIGDKIPWKNQPPAAGTPPAAPSTGTGLTPMPPGNMAPGTTPPATNENLGTVPGQVPTSMTDEKGWRDWSKAASLEDIMKQGLTTGIPAGNVSPEQTAAIEYATTGGSANFSDYLTPEVRAWGDELRAKTNPAPTQEEILKKGLENTGMNFAGYEGGGKPPANKPFIVGESGPELGILDKGRVTIVPLRQIPGMQGGGVIDYGSGVLPWLNTPSMQYWARMGPTSQQQYYGYQQANTGQLPEETNWRMWQTAPPSGRNTGIQYRR